MKVLITGARGFLGRNLVAHLRQRSDVEVLPYNRESTCADLVSAAAEVDFIFHLAGVNRPKELSHFATGNAELTRQLCQAVNASSRRVPILFTSSIQAAQDNPYGVSKRQAEAFLIELQAMTRIRLHIFRLPNVFGKWCRPNYNSVVATFCHNIARDLPIQINDASAVVKLVYVDDLIARFLELMDGRSAEALFSSVEPEYSITVGGLAEQIRAFRTSRSSLLSERVGSGLTRALYATYVTYLPVDDFVYTLSKHEDSRGVFVEVLKTFDSGQFSFFTAHPGVTRGGHYHHSKTEKFLVIKGSARFRFRNIMTNEFHEVFTSAESPRIVETIPGWTHDISNIGENEMIVMLWANEIFDRNRPDTYTCPV